MDNIKLKRSNNTVLKDKFFDIELIYSFFISAILHVLLVSTFLFLLWSYFDDSYKQLAKSIFIKPDIIFNLKPFHPTKENPKNEKIKTKLKTETIKTIKE